MSKIIFTITYLLCFPVIAALIVANVFISISRVLTHNGHPAKWMTCLIEMVSQIPYKLSTK